MSSFQIVEAGRHGECVNDDIKLLGLQPEWTVFRDMRGDSSYRANVSKLLLRVENMDVFKINDDDFFSKHYLWIQQMQMMIMRMTT